MTDNKRLFHKTNSTNSSATRTVRVKVVPLTPTTSCLATRRSDSGKSLTTAISEAAKDLAEQVKPK